jgi:hypothetical protein
LDWIELRVVLVKQTLEDGSGSTSGLLSLFHSVNDEWLDVSIESHIVLEVRREYIVRLRT